MMSNRLRARALLIAVSLALASSGCASAGAGGFAVNGNPVLPKVPGVEKHILNVAISPVVDSAGFYVAQRLGLFAQEGLTVNYSPAHGDTVISDAVRGKYDIIATNYVSYVEAQSSHQANLRIIAEGSLLTPGSRVIMTLPGSPVQTLAELRGHVLGVNPDANIGFLLAASVLTGEGVPMSQGHGSSHGAVSFPAFSMPYPDASPALVSRQVAAAVMSEPFATQVAEQHGAIAIADLDSGATQQFPVEGYAVTRDWAARYPNTLKAFLAALEAGQQRSDIDRRAVEDAYVALQPGAGHIDQRTAALMAINEYPLGVDATRLQRVPDVMRQFGFLRQHFSISQLLS
jgi:NitT/TauT family transport system substrate-binding protein